MKSIIFSVLVFSSFSNGIRVARELPKDLFDWHIIFPGTKWCGTGDIAYNDTDFGTFEKVDKCCHAHDQCPDYIAGFETKYNLTNPTFFSRLPCSCDLAFYNCLKNVDTLISTKVGFVFFTILNTKCYKKEYPYKCTKYSIIPPRCVETELDKTKEQVYQWFDVPVY